ncbi:hypothetical protein Ait01nite_089310 [Actinoplanes italicus]|uniref:Uncharacterized protein n=1 Tax=Actinoplanes italicus TaxID=113567 RepID=A0A2T0JI77_9ACTN|nr:hypothetical protein [Actinoplanes italicus]PRX07347.1 hypothetical protein CLV67_14222 [Actinoplanes italicus]GIE35886.1 hypothetical protein Ait01nite_089310 [Actinoplanes italicus]
MVKVPYGAKLNREQRMAAAAVSGHAERLIQALGRDVDEQTVAELHAITRDPIVYGIELGNVLGRIEKTGWTHLQRLADAYRAAGADLEVADRQRLWVLRQPGIL